MRMALLTLTILALPIGCSAADGDKDGTSITLNAKDETGAVVEASADGKTGTVAVNVPGLKAQVELPKIHLNASDFEMNGAKLYPGSQINAVNIKGDETGVWADKGQARVTFTAPADRATVKSWFAKELAEKGKYKVAESADGLTGSGEGGKAFKLVLTELAGGKTQGVLAVSGE